MTLHSVGIDVGTSTTQLIFSRLTVENRANAYSVPDFEISGREILYRSPVSFTPLLSPTRLDARGIREIVAGEYKSAGIRPESISTGAIIITGETARKENAGAVLDSLKTFAGQFVVATAGPDLESVLAAKGSGAVAYARQTGKTVLHMDIGGGTSNLALIRDGEITQTGCLNVGGRLIRVEGGKIAYVSPVLSGLCRLCPGDLADEAALAPVISLLVEALQCAAGLSPGPAPKALVTNRLPVLPKEPLVLSFSGGVADLIEDTGSQSFAYGDLGVLLGRAIRTSALCQGPYRLGEETIRATVIGAGCHATQLSGSTVFARGVSFPLQNLPVIALRPEAPDLVKQVEAQKLRWESGPVALFLKGQRGLDFSGIQALADTLVPALEGLPTPRVVVARADMGKALGHALALRLPGPLLCLDGLELPEESFLDVSTPVGDGAVYPVVKKTLVLG